MKTEIKIILQEGSSNKAQGNCFENLVRKLMTCHQYEIKGNVNFSGMEIDLIANHKHKDEEIYVECKAKEKVSSDELSKFAFNVMHKKADAGYFYRTKELEFQAGALLTEMKSDQRYNHLTFFEPKDILNILKDSDFIQELSSITTIHKISKKILAITYFGDFLIYLIDSSSALPTHYALYDATNNPKEINDDHIATLKERIAEIQDLVPIKVENENRLTKIDKQVIEAISEVGSSPFKVGFVI